MLVVASNQRGIARGMVGDDLLRATERTLQEALAPHGVRIAGFYYCPHEIDEDCDCRKPKPGLLLRAAEELGLDLGASWMVGDSAADVTAGTLAGCRTAFLGPGAGPEATISAPSLREAADRICAG